MTCSTPAFNPDTDIPDMSGRRIFVTGGTAGLGKETILQLAKHNPEHIYFTGRNTNRANEVMSAAQAESPSLQITFVELDMTSLQSVKNAMTSIKIPELDILICNAGVMAIDPGLSQDGYEIQFAINHLAHALIIKHLLTALQASASHSRAKPRIIFLTSVAGLGFRTKSGIHFDELKTTMDSSLPHRVFDRWYRYGQSKLANMLYPQALTQNYPEFISVSVHPGVSNTNLVMGLPWGHRMFVHATTVGMVVHEKEAAWNSLWAATTAEENVKSGEFYRPVGESKNSDRKGWEEKDLAERLWSWTQSALKGF